MNEDTYKINVIDLSALSFIEMIEELRKRPLLWLSVDNIDCLNSFLTGWFIAKENSEYEKKLIKGFQRKVEELLGQKRTSLGWCELIKAHVNDSSTALDKFFEYWSIYISDESSKE